ncbi:hypothetical protein E1193_00065 [Micromonospora sp. KC606]|uniref:hypothetical protein n=1 Tax=Micromonospora sp. KC606 TaxID=2530379 RepID=UPI001045AD04|nr:hypothetical protein [Micromonospora sp. KC606]TDC86108.1 hypothetical protein E1193_00065 [Micromonospora sp. KC606]
MTMIETAARTTRNRRSNSVFVLACVSLVLSVIACGVAGLVFGNELDPLPVQSGPQVASAAQVEAVAHVTLPPGTVLLSAAYSNGLETQLSAKFRIPRTALDAFIAEAKFTAAPAPGVRAVDARHNVGGGNLWDPEAAWTVSGVVEEQPTADGTGRSVLFNLDAPDVVTVYLYASRN